MRFGRLDPSVAGISSMELEGAHITQLMCPHFLQERLLLKKFKGIGDGGVDIFFREAQVG